MLLRLARDAHGERCRICAHRKLHFVFAILSLHLRGFSDS